MLDWLMEPINAIITWLEHGIYDFFVETFEYFGQVLTLFFTEITTSFISFAWGLAKEIISSFGLDDDLSNTWSALPPDIVSIIGFFGIPAVINIIMAALITSFVLKFIPFLGK